MEPYVYDNDEEEEITINHEYVVHRPWGIVEWFYSLFDKYEN